MADAFTVIAGKPQIVKDPNAVLDYTVDFEAWLLPTADTISSATVTGSGVRVSIRCRRCRGCIGRCAARG